MSSTELLSFGNLVLLHLLAQMRKFGGGFSSRIAHRNSLLIKAIGNVWQCDLKNEPILAKDQQTDIIYFADRDRLWHWGQKNVALCVCTIRTTVPV